MPLICLLIYILKSLLVIDVLALIFLSRYLKWNMIKEKTKTQGKERINTMILKLKKSVRKQAKCVHKETEKLFKTLKS